jgi:hypothetical protein
MYQFARLLTLQGDTRETMAWATEITALVNDRVGLDVSLWASVFGYPVGTVGWSAIVEGRAQLEQETAPLATDEEYLDLVAKAADWVHAPAEDILRSIVHGGPGDEPPAVGAVASVTEAVAATGKMSEAIGWATDMATYATELTDAQVNFLVNAYGVFGGMAFITIFPDMAAADAATETIRADAGYIQRVDSTGGLFVEGSSHQSLLQQMA